LRLDARREDRLQDHLELEEGDPELEQSRDRIVIFGKNFPTLVVHDGIDRDDRCIDLAGTGLADAAGLPAALAALAKGKSAVGPGGVMASEWSAGSVLDMRRTVARLGELGCPTAQSSAPGVDLCP
jgi:hypothetical protein